MSVSQVAMISAGAFVVVPVVIATVLIAVGSRARPKYARAIIGIDERGSSASYSASHMSPGPAVQVVAPSGMTTDPAESGPQALRDAVDMRPGRGAEVFV